MYYFFLLGISICTLGILPLRVFGQPQEKIGNHHVEILLKKEGLTPNDVKDLRVSHQHLSSVSQITHLYLQQYYCNIPINQGVASLHFDAEHRLLFESNQLIPNLSGKTKSTVPQIKAKTACEKAITFIREHQADERSENQNKTPFFPLSPDDLVQKTDLVYQLVETGEMVLCYAVEIKNKKGHWQILVSANTGKVLDAANLTLSCDFSTPLQKSITKKAINHKSFFCLY